MSTPTSLEDAMSVAQTQPEIAALETAVKTLQTSLEAQNKTLADLAKSNDAARQNPFGAPAVRRGEDTMGSRGYSFIKALGVMSGNLDKSQATVEVEIHEKLKAYNSGLAGYTPAQQKSFYMPISADFLLGDQALAAEVKGVTKAGVCATDPGEVSYLRNKLAQGGYTKALSWLDESAGASLVGPPAFGELIEVLRNNAVLMAAGATVLPMPPTGRMIWPRQTSAGNAYHRGESVTLTESTPGTGDVTLSAKKLTALMKYPNELYQFSSVPVENFVRNDMGKVIALKMDVTLLESAGSSTEPKGLINYANITTHTSNGTPASGNAGYPIHPRDPYEMIAKVEEQNATFRAFVMRPLLWAGMVNKRADAVSAGDQAGPFLFNIVREPGLNMNVDRMTPGNLSGYPVFKTTQVSTARTRGSASTLTYVLGGDFADFMIAMSPAIEFAITNQAGTSFETDQTWYRGITYYDGAPKHEASFVLMDQMTQSGF